MSSRDCYLLTISGRKAFIEETMRRFSSPDDSPEEIAATRAEIVDYINKQAYAIARKHLFTSNGNSVFPPAGKQL